MSEKNKNNSSLIPKINIFNKLFSVSEIIQNLIFFFLIISSFSFSFINHPLSIGILLIIQTISIALFTGIITKSF